MVIGITLGLQSEHESVWVNGIKLNAIFLAKCLKKIGKHEVIILDTSDKVKDLTKVNWDPIEFPVKRYWDVWKDVDILITLGTSFPKENMDQFKASGKNKKVIKYMCGNNYVIDMERAIFTEGKDMVATWDLGADEVWYVPQQGYQNHYYYKTIFRCNAIPVPFVWDPMFLDLDYKVRKNLSKNLPTYVPRPAEEKKISVFEPNLNTVKYSMIPIMIAEESYRAGAKFESIQIASGEKLLKNGYYKTMIKQLDIVSEAKPPKIKFTPRYPVCHYLAEATDVVISHQWENPLNYAYLDVLYYNFPLIHNADMIQDAGYYYPDFNIEVGSNLLNWVLRHHDENLEEYNKKNQEIIKRYTVENDKLVETYDKLIKNLYKKNRKLDWKYDWKTNISE
jgi:hypothetical protein